MVNEEKSETTAVSISDLKVLLLMLTLYYPQQPAYLLRHVYFYHFHI